MRCVIDTCIMNALLDGRIGPGDLPSDGDYLVTHVQRDELVATRDPVRRSALLGIFRDVIDESIPTESAVVGVSKVGRCRAGDGVLYQALVADLDALNGGKRNNAQDALIAESAIANDYVLVTSDYHLHLVAKNRRCHVIYLDSHA